ncbi:MAG: Gfo/Idh/MocA family oxidoreductase [Bythopirellula sp.]|nr:Gfo/Idh/MocA family oxidoreductase [Bythopirellula sp.]
MPHINRRGFLQSSAATAAALAASTSFAAPVKEPLHFALIGAGGKGRHCTIDMLRIPGTKLTAICEINPECVFEAKKLGSDARVYEDWNELLAKESDLQAVIVALPEDTHAAAAIAAMEAGRDVFCEKPMAYSIDEARQMNAVRDRTGRVLQIGQQRRSNPLYYLAERLVQQEGLIGEVIRVDAFWDRWEDWKRPLPTLDKDFSRWSFPTLDHLINWRLYRKYGHGLMTENGTHQMDACSWILGGKLPQRVCGMGVSLYPDERETYDAVTAEYLFEGDTLVRFSQDFHQGLNYGWSYGELFLGSEGALRITAEQELVHYDRARKATKISITKLGDFDLAGLACPVAEMLQAEQSTGGGLRDYSYAQEFRSFVHAMQNRTAPSCPGEIGLKSIAMTVTGAEAQYAGEFRKFTPEMFG